MVMQIKLVVVVVVVRQYISLPLHKLLRSFGLLNTLELESAD